MKDLTGILRLPPQYAAVTGKVPVRLVGVEPFATATGTLLRWRFEAEDRHGARWPLLYLTGTVLTRRVRRLLEALGEAPPDTARDAEEFDPATLIGRECMGGVQEGFCEEQDALQLVLATLDRRV